MIPVGRAIMENDVFLGCLQCKSLFRPTCYDSHPAFYFNKEKGSVEEVEMDDLSIFKEAHKDHQIIRLHIVNESFCGHDAFWSPIREDYFQVTDGSQVYTVKRWRKDIYEPLRYDIVNEHIEFEKPMPQIQSTELRLQMLYDSRTLKLSEDKITEFIESYNNFISNINLEDTIECGLSADDPTVSYAALKDEAIEKFLSYCRSSFTEEEHKQLKVFIVENSVYNDVMNLRITHPFKLIPIENHN